MTQWIISSSILILIVIALRFLLRKRIKPILQYALWAVVLVRLLVPLQLGSTGFSLENAVEKAPVMQQMELADEITYFVYHIDGTATGYYAYQPPYDHTQPEAPAPKPVPQTFTRQEAQSITRIRDIKQIIHKVWLGGMAVFGLIFLLSNLRFALRLRNAQKAGQEGNLPIYITDKVETPCLFGLLRPGIYLPPAVAEEPRHRNYSVAHEATHFRHGDALWSVLRCVCIVLHWYNPLVWWAAVLSREDGEIACDEATITTLGESLRGDYGRVLVDLTCRKRTDLLQTATTMTGSAKGLKQRISMIVKRPKMAISALICLILVAAMAIGCTFTGGKKPGKQPPVHTPETTESTEPTKPTEPTENTPKPNANKTLPAGIPGTPLKADELAYFTELFSGLHKENEEINWYNILLFCGWNLTGIKGFAVPEDVNLDTLFNNGFGAISYESSWTPEESAFIQGIYPGYPTNYGDLYRLPASMINQVLQDYLGITLEQSNKVGLDKMVYFPHTDCYFGAPAGAVGEGNVKMADGKRAADGTVYLLYCEDQSFREGKILLRLAPNPGNEKIPYRVLSCLEIEDDSDYAKVMLTTMHLPSAAASKPPFNHKYFLHHNRPGSEVMNFGYDGKDFTLENLAENGLYAVDDGAVYTISNQAVSEWEWDKFNDYIYFVRQNDPRKIWRTDLHGQNPTPVYESQYGDITFLSYYRDSHDWLLLIENSNRCAFLDMTAKKMTILPQVHYMEQFSYDAEQMRIFWKGQLNKSDPEMPLGGYTYYYYLKTNEYQVLKDNNRWETVTPEA